MQNTFFLPVRTSFFVITFAVVYVSKLEIANVLSNLNEANRIKYFGGENNEVRGSEEV